MAIDREQARLFASYDKFFSSPEGREVFADLVLFAQHSDITESRLLGRADVVVRIERQRQRGIDAQPAKVVRASASMQPRVETEQE